jgi:hypothetical protein
MPPQQHLNVAVTRALSSSGGSLSLMSPPGQSSCRKPPLKPHTGAVKAPSPSLTPCPSPKHKATCGSSGGSSSSAAAAGTAAAAAASGTDGSRDYCRGRFQVHEAPLLGPSKWTSGAGSSSSSLQPSPTAAAAAAAAVLPAGTLSLCGDARSFGPVSAVDVFAAHLQQHEDAAAAAAELDKARCGQELPSGSTGAPTAAAATSVKLGRFTVRQEPAAAAAGGAGGGGGGCGGSSMRGSRSSSCARSPRGSRACSPRPEAAAHLTKLGSGRWGLCGWGCQGLGVRVAARGSGWLLAAVGMRHYFQMCSTMGRVC